MADESLSNAARDAANRANRVPEPPVAAWAAFRNLVAEVAGPMAVLTIGAQKLIASIAQTALNAKKLQEALNASSGAEQLRRQFEGIGLSAPQARQKVAELAQIASSSAFNLESLGAASKNLQVVGGAALNTRDNLRKVADMAAAAGVPIDNMATAYARLIASMKGGGGVEAAQQMAELGAISNDTAKKIQDITAAGGSFSEKMNALSGDIARSKGAAAEFGTTVAGLQAKLAALGAANSLKIGDMFVEGEKSALRAEIAFKSFKNALDESTSAPLAALSEMFNKVKESVANFVTTGYTARGIAAALNVVFSAAVGIFSASAFALLGFIRTLATLGASAFTAAGGMTALNATLRAWVGLGAASLGAMSAIATAVVLFGARALQTAQQLDVLVKKNKELAESGAAGSRKIEALAPKIQAGTVEDKQAAMEQANAGVDDAQNRVTNANKALSAEKQQDTGWNRAVTMDWFGVIANQRKISAEGEVGSAENELNRRKNARSDIAAISSEGLGMDRENLQKKFQRNDLVENIRNSAFENLQASSDPESAARMSANELKRATEKDDRNQIVSKQSYEERQKINDKSTQIATADTAEKKDKAFEELKGITTQTKSGGIQQDIDYRKSLAMESDNVKSEAAEAKVQLQEKIKARGSIKRKTSNGANINQDEYDEANKAVQEAERKVADIEARGRNVKSRSAGIDISGNAIQQREIERDAALKEEDPNVSTRQKEEARIKNQASQEALAARNKMIQRQSEKSDLETKLSSISDSGENAEYKIKAQSSSDQKNNLAALAAAQNLAQKNNEYDQSRGTLLEEGKRSELEQARTQAAGAGVDGRTVAQIEAELNIERQITQQKLQSAKVAEAGAKAEYDAAMRRLNVEHQISQMKADQAKSNNDGTAYKGKTEAGITQDAAKKEVDAQEKALQASRAKDTAQEAYKNAPTAGNKQALDEATKQAAAAGVGDRRTRDVEKDVKSAKGMQSDALSREANASADARDELKIQSLRVSEKYGATGKEREASRKAADDLEDRRATQARAKELGQSISDPNQANQLADIQVRRERLVKNIEREGTPQASEMARMGGSSGFAGVVGNSQDVQKKIAELNQKQHDILADMKTKNDQLFPIIKALLDQQQ